MAVDYQTPLVTNVKNAKLLIEAISRHYDLEILSIDAQTSQTAVLPAPSNTPASPELRSAIPHNYDQKPSEFHGPDQSALSSRQAARHLDNHGIWAAGVGPSAMPDGFDRSILFAGPYTPFSLLQLLLNSPFKQRHILSVNDFTRQDLHVLFTVAQEMRLGVQRLGVLDLLRGRLLCTVFYEPSTRTSASFDAAMQRLGGRTIVVPTQHSSTQKGESLQDTIRTLACYSDAIVLRHPDPNSAAMAAKISPVPIINGGNGSIEHPTQAFLDLYTIREELGTANGRIITFVGDLRYGRTVHSLCKLLAHYAVSIQLVSPAALALPAEARQALISSGQLLAESTTLDAEIVARSDVLYCTRVQKERFDDLDEYERLKDGFVVDNRVLKKAKKSMVVMHPLPRNQEIDPEVDDDRRAAYFRQVGFCVSAAARFCARAMLIACLDAIWIILPHGAIGPRDGALDAGEADQAEGWMAADVSLSRQYHAQ
jgi:carbamoyl-phosphate synthase/aspartate carbamoyltransferase